MVSNQETIKKLKEELNTYNKKDQEKMKILKERQEIEKLKKEIRSKKYGGFVRFGKNLKVIGSNFGKEIDKFAGNSKNPSGEKKKPKSMEEFIRDLPQ